MIENGIVTSNGSVVASIATFTCHFGCELIGDSHSICQHNGTWSNTVPECHRKLHAEHFNFLISITLH